MTLLNRIELLLHFAETANKVCALQQPCGLTSERQWSCAIFSTESCTRI